MQEQIDEFVLPDCANCGGPLKPDIVFFGDNVSRRVVQRVRHEVDNADALLVLGTSLATFSGYRIVLQASEANKPLLLVNIGPTRADHLANLKVHDRCSHVLSQIYPNLLCPTIPHIAESTR